MVRTVKLLYLSSTEWGNLGRRKVRLAAEFARLPDVAALLFVNPPVGSSVLDVMRGRLEPSHLGPTRRAHARALVGVAERAADRLWVMTASEKVLPLTRLPAVRRLGPLLAANEAIYWAAIRRQLRRLPGQDLVLWLSHPLQAGALDRFTARRVACFDWTDDWLQFDRLPVEDRTRLEGATERVLRESDRVLAVSEALRRRASEVNPHVVLAPNATDVGRMTAAATGQAAPAAELSSVPTPRLGYIGQIADNLDVDLVAEVARRRPEWSWVFVGPIWSTREDAVARLVALGNVHFVGGQPHRRLPEFLAGFSVCVLPHLRNALTDSMDPTKIYDYLASGRPIVSTSVAGVERFGDLVRCADVPEMFSAAVACALAEGPRRREERLRVARLHDWSARAAEIWASVRP